jgi:peptide-methionine (S)-S-oxide reductase
VGLQKETKMTEKATFAAGCFWGVEAAFWNVDGVVSTTVGYTGGTVANPSYEQVCTGRTGHAEAVEIVYDPERVSYEDLLETFWSSHDPTTLNRQGPDVGTQYRSAIFVHDDGQKTAALESRQKVEESGRFRRPVVTEITPAGEFYRAEEYHQKYFDKHGIAHCPI